MMQGRRAVSRDTAVVSVAPASIHATVPPLRVTHAHRHSGSASAATPSGPPHQRCEEWKQNWSRETAVVASYRKLNGVAWFRPTCECQRVPYQSRCPANTFAALRRTSSASPPASSSDGARLPKPEFGLQGCKAAPSLESSPRVAACARASEHTEPCSPGKPFAYQLWMRPTPAVKDCFSWTKLCMMFTFSAQPRSAHLPV
jgi:hypothetical protein